MPVVMKLAHTGLVDRVAQDYGIGRDVEAGRARAEGPSIEDGTGTGRAKAEDKFIDAVKVIAFPAEIQPDATKLVKASIVTQRAALSASKAKNWEQLNERAKDAIKADKKAVDLAAILRDALGLPPDV
jgi:hypothetical protein